MLNATVNSVLRIMGSPFRVTLTTMGSASIGREWVVVYRTVIQHSLGGKCEAEGKNDAPHSEFVRSHGRRRIGTFPSRALFAICCPGFAEYRWTGACASWHEKARSTMCRTWPP